MNTINRVDFEQFLLLAWQNPNIQSKYYELRGYMCAISSMSPPPLDILSDLNTLIDVVYAQWFHL